MSPDIRFTIVESNDRIFSTKVRLNGRESKAFSVKVGVHQGSVLSPLLFIIVLEALSSSREFREGYLPMEMFYADDLVFDGGIEGIVEGQVEEVEKGMEAN